MTPGSLGCRKDIVSAGCYENNTSLLVDLRQRSRVTRCIVSDQYCFESVFFMEQWISRMGLRCLVKHVVSGCAVA